ncbi:MAG: hypothetical protein IKE70_04230 [Bacilli bacterium]|nr:hypothetical protein [Bacilli bacterium]
MAYDNQCGSCDYFKDPRNTNQHYPKNNPSNIKGYCEWYQQYYYPDDTCNHHRSRDYVPGGCFITTVVCEKLGLDDSCLVLSRLREFRREVLQKDITYAPILFQYDMVGPQISEEIKKDTYDISQKIYDCFLVPIVESLNKKKHEEAVSRYIFMTNSLEKIYAIEDFKEMDSSYDYQNGGHGYFKRLFKKTVSS